MGLSPAPMTPTDFHAIVSRGGRVAIWPSGEDLPEGWRALPIGGSLTDCALHLSKTNAPRGTNASALEIRPVSAKPRGHPLSASQRLMLMVQDAGLFPDQGFMIPSLQRIRGELSPSRLESALRSTAQRHGSLRTRFQRRTSGATRQIVDPVLLDDAVVHVDVSCSKDPPNEARRQVRLLCQRPLELEREHPFRAAIIRIGPADHLLAIFLHHLVADGWSLELLLAEAGHAYAGSRDVPTDAPQLQHVDFVNWESNAERTGSFDAGLAFWEAHLKGLRPLPLLPPAIFGAPGGGTTLKRRLPPETRAGLRELCRAEKVTPFMVSLAGLVFLLSARHRIDDVTIATQMSNRAASDTHGIIGYLANTVLLRTQLPPKPTFRGALRAVRKTCLEAARHQQVPFLALVEALGLELLGFDPAVAERVLTEALDGARDAAFLSRALRDVERHPVVVFQYAELAALELPGCDVELEALEELDSLLEATPLDVHVALVQTGGDFELYLNFQRALPTPTFAVELANDYVRTLSTVLAEPEIGSDELREQLSRAN